MSDSREEGLGEVPGVLAVRGAVTLERDGEAEGGGEAGQGGVGLTPAIGS